MLPRLSLGADEFVALCKNYHFLMMPAFTLQRKVREKIWGSTALMDWAKLEEKRKSLSYLNLQDIVAEVDDMIEVQKHEKDRKTVVSTEKFKINNDAIQIRDQNQLSGVGHVKDDIAHDGGKIDKRHEQVRVLKQT